MRCSVCGKGRSFKKHLYKKALCQSCRAGCIIRECPESHYYFYQLLKDDKIVYVGITYDPDFRFTNHIKTKEFDIMLLTKGFPTFKEARAYEKEQISLLKPALNGCR